MTSPAESPSQSNDPAASAAPPLQLTFFTKAFASALFSGYSPVATGTIGSAVGLAFYLIPGFEHPYVIIPASFAVMLLGAKTAGLMEMAYGHDPAEVTIDEVLGMWVSLLLLPKSLLIALSGFFLFRVFDIIKPFPARKFDSMHGGLGVMLDDVISGVYTNLLLHLFVALNVLQ